MVKTVFITGGSRGIGADTVRAFTSKGYNVAFTYYKSEEKAKELAKETGAKAYYCDASNSDNVNNAVSLASKDFGGVDILINNAGTQNEADIDVNLKGQLYFDGNYGKRPLSRRY